MLQLVYLDLANASTDAVDADTVATCKEPDVAGTEPAATGTDVVA